MTRQEKLWSELSKEEKAEEKREFLESYVLECGGDVKDYEVYWEEYLNQEGWTGRDEAILMKRDRIAYPHPGCAHPSCRGTCLDKMEEI